MAARKTSGGPLAGIRVVDLTTVVVGPTATLFLADYGAEVIKVEAPGGDLLRTLGGRSKSGQLSGKFTHFNRNKRSIVLDLKQAKAQEVLHKLLATADHPGGALAADRSASASPPRCPLWPWSPAAAPEESR